MKKLTKFWPQAALLLVGLIWGSSNVIIKNAVDQIPPAFLIAMRCTIAAPLLAILFRKHLRGTTAADVRSGAIIGVCLFLAYWIQACSMCYIAPGKSGFLTSIYCVMVPFVYWAVSRRAPTLRNLLAAGLCVCGVALCSLTGSFTIAWGDTLALICGLFSAAHVVSVGICGQGRDPFRITVLQFIAAAIVGWGVSLCTEASRICLPTGALFDVFYLALACTGLALLLQNISQQRVEPNTASILTSTESVFGVMFSVLLGYETLNARLLGGFALIFAAILVSQLQFPTKERKKE